VIFFDTNVVSELMRKEANPQVREWFLRQYPSELVLSAVAVMEISYGAERIFLRDKNNRFRKGLDILLDQSFPGRLVPFDLIAAKIAGQFKARRENAGKPISVQNAMIAAICAANGGVLATRNVKDFEGLDLTLVNPFEEAGL
jgi:toxin FitB